MKRSRVKLELSPEIIISMSQDHVFFSKIPLFTVKSKKCCTSSYQVKTLSGLLKHAKKLCRESSNRSGGY